MANKIATLTKTLLLLVMVLGFTACESDESIYDQIVGRTWAGDLGFVDDYDDALESGVSFYSDGFGEDEQCCDICDYCIKPLRIRWWIENDILFLDYGNRLPLLELRGVYVEGRFLTGTLYADGVREEPVTLRMLD